MIEAIEIQQQVTFLYCDDLERATLFYRDVVGLKMVLDQGGCRIFGVAGEAFLGICQCREERSVSSDGVTFTFVTQNVDHWYDRLCSAGIETLGPPSRSDEFQIYRFFARDPEGHLLEFQRFLNPAWPHPVSAQKR